MTQPDSPVHYAARFALLALAYYLAARLGLELASIGQSISLVWPPTGIAMAALVLLGPRYWPGVLLGAFLANAGTDIPILAAAGIAVGNTLEAVTAALLLRRVGGARPDLENIRVVRTLVLVAAPAGALVSAVLGVGTLRLLHDLPAGMATGMATWWAGDLLGALVVAPLLLAWQPARPSRGARGIIEISAVCLGTAAAAELGLGRWLQPGFLTHLEYPFLLFPFVLWAALRFGSRGATLLTFVVSLVAVWHTLEGRGPFLSASPLETLFAVAIYLVIVAGTGLVLAAAVSHERNAAREELGRSKDQLRRSLDAARMGTWFWSMEDDTLSWDENMKGLYGLGRADPVTGYGDFIGRVHPEDRPTVEATIRLSLEQDGELDYEFRIVLPNGEVRWIADQGHVVRDETGNPKGMTGVCMDVTDRRVSEERIRQAHRMESVGRLAGGVAHETNNQMSVVLGASRFVLMRPDLPEAVRQDVTLIQEAAERTAGVTAQLLAFSRRQVMNRQVVDLNQVIRDWEPALRRAIGEDYTITLDLAGRPALVRADPGQLHHAMLNLAINAKDAMPGGGTLSIETAVTTLTSDYARARPDIVIQPGEYVRLAVSDTGHGIGRDAMEHVFEPFFSTKPVGQGTGLGLATVYGIVKQSDGYVWAYSEPGRGATFKLYFPVSRETQSPVIVPLDAIPRGNGEGVLVVEDEEGVRQVVTRALTEAGYRVLEAPDGETALALFRGQAGRIALLLTDVIMPRMNGNELARVVRAQVAGLPVIFMSGYTDGEISRRGLLEPGAAFIQKPFSPEVLVRTVTDTLSRSTGPAR